MASLDCYSVLFCLVVSQCLVTISTVLFQNASSTLKQVYNQKHPLAMGAPEASLLHFVSMDWPILEMSHKCNWTTCNCLIAMPPLLHLLVVLCDPFPPLSVPRTAQVRPFLEAHRWEVKWQSHQVTKEIPRQGGEMAWSLKCLPCKHEELS